METNRGSRKVLPRQAAASGSPDSAGFRLHEQCVTRSMAAASTCHRGRGGLQPAQPRRRSSCPARPNRGGSGIRIVDANSKTASAVHHGLDRQRREKHTAASNPSGSPFSAGWIQRRCVGRSKRGRTRGTPCKPTAIGYRSWLIALRAAKAAGVRTDENRVPRPNGGHERHQPAGRSRHGTLSWVNA